MQILSTKLSIPPSRPRLVKRLGLFQKLSQGVECGFVLVSAPAGYGKSTLLSDWLNHARVPFAWLSLDQADNDPNRFLAYLAAALRGIDPSIEEPGNSALPSQPPLEIEARLTPLINTFARSKSSAILLLDEPTAGMNPRETDAAVAANAAVGHQFKHDLDAVSSRPVRGSVDGLCFRVYA